ncbi:MAG: hypothetical protein EBZ48_13905 [Proteobacteria bacterium]|nr:hypothetical protein [Pseudomonadota bacterium]
MRSTTIVHKPLTTTVVFALCGLALLALAGCSSTVARKEPGTRVFPEVTGSSLDGKKVMLPHDLKGSPAILLVGYVQETQFDLDRWILGLKQLGTTVRILEIPTIVGVLPKAASNFIDSGMRSGIPKEDWPIVVTVYGDAQKIVDITGNENPRNGRIFLLDKDGIIRWFFDRGYSADRVIELNSRSKDLS